MKSVFFLPSTNIHIRRGIFSLLFLSVVCYISYYLIYSARHEYAWTYNSHKEISQLKADPGIYNSFTIHENGVYFGTINGDTYSLNAVNGSLNWRHSAFDYSIYPAAFDTKGSMFISNFDGRIYAIDTKTGSEKWRLSLTDNFRLDTEPVYSDGKVFAGSRDGSFYAINSDTGSILWTFSPGAQDISSHTPLTTIFHFGRFTVDTKIVYINSAPKKKIYALDKLNGHVLWEINTQEFIFQKPTVFEKTISFTDPHNTFNLVDKKSGEIVFSTETQSNSILTSNKCIFITHWDGAVECINTDNGKRKWLYSTDNETTTLLKVVESNRLLIQNRNLQSDILSLLDGDTGTVLWTQSFAHNQSYSVQHDSKHVYIIGSQAQCAITYEGKPIWCAKVGRTILNSFYSTSGIYIVSKDDTEIFLTFVESVNGHVRWTYHSKNINEVSIKIHRNNMFFTSKDNTSVTMINPEAKYTFFSDSDIRNAESTMTTYEKAREQVLALVRFFPQIGAYINTRKPATITAQRNVVERNSLFEIDILQDESSYANKYADINVHALIIDPKGKEYRIQAFYYDHEHWKLRFTPNITGLWKWKIEGAISPQKIGTFLVINSTDIGFISLSKTDAKLFTDESGSIFIPIGIQTCVNDLNQDGDPLNQWPLNTDIRVVSSHDGSYPTTSFESFLETHEKSGFNIFRWGDSNCSFQLWDLLSEKGNVYKINNGTYLDKMFRMLREHNQHIWMSLLSFSLPFDTTLPLHKQQDILRSYIDYIVARYASYVDVWELTNEIRLPDSLVVYMAQYLRSIDPYKHPITTSWEKPHLDEIEIISFHWYPGECNEYCEEDYRRQFLPFESYKKPIVVSEQGNSYGSWDEYSGIRYRMRLWINFFEKNSFIVWGMPSKLFENKDGPSNIYIGPLERKYVEVFSKTIADIGDSLVKHTATSSNEKDTVYSIKSGNIIYGYISRRVIHPIEQPSEISVEIPGRSEIQWIDPATGSVLNSETINLKRSVITTPIFSSDIVFKIVEKK